jgi:hypothetical protein
MRAPWPESLNVSDDPVRRGIETSSASVGAGSMPVESEEDQLAEEVDDPTAILTQLKL